jgi:hypothetical protein
MPEAEQALAADSPGAAFIRSCVGEPLKRIYKASQAKKKKTSPRGARELLFFTSPHPELLQKLTNVCNRIILWTAFGFCFLL